MSDTSTTAAFAPELGRVSIWETVKWIWPHWVPDRKWLPRLMLLTVANASIVIAYPLFLKQVVDGIEQLSNWHSLIPSIAGLLFAGVLQFIVYNSMQSLRAKTNLRMQFGVRMRAFEHLLGAGPDELMRFRTGDVVTRLNDDVNEKLAWFLCSGTLRVIEASAIIVWGLAAMLWLNPWLTLMTAGPLPILIGAFVISSNALHARYQSVQASISALNEQLESCFSGIRTVKAFAAEPFQRKLVRSAVEQQKQAELRSVRWQTVIDSLYGNIWQLAVVGVLIAGGSMAVRGTITVGEIVAFEAYILLLVWPMFDIGQFLVTAKRSRVCIQRIRALEQAQNYRGSIESLPPSRRPEHHDTVEAIDVNSGSGPGQPSPLGKAPTITFSRVNYRYPQQAQWAIHDVSLTIESGQTIGLVGAVGDGKSTLMRLVTGNLVPQSGRVDINGTSVLQINRHELSDMVGWAPQDPQLISMSLLDNVRLGRVGLEDQSILRCLELVELADDVADWPDGPSTLLGTRGRQLSGGQQQRVSLARAIAAHPSLLLLDDCTSNLDSETESRVWQNLRETLNRSTVLVSTHRVDVLAQCDRLIVLEAGSIVESGTLADLNQPGTRFHELYRHWQMEQLAGLE